MTGFDQKRIDEINERLSRITNGQWERGKTGGTVIAAAPDDIRFLLDMVTAEAVAR